MNLKNLMMWGLIVVLVVGLFNMFQNPKKNMVSEKTPFSEFLKNVDDGRVVQVEIKGNDIEVFYQMAQHSAHTLQMIQT